jgi:chromosome partitioning protein
MKTLVCLSQKGGTGKTTLTLHLAVAAEQSGHLTTILDLDPQASAMGWKDTRQAQTPAVMPALASRLPQVLKAAEQAGAALCILDTASHTESTALAAARMADLVLIPCRPAILDLRAISLTVDILQLARKPAVVILNAVPSRGTLADDAVEALASYRMDIAPIRIAQRSAFVHALTLGLTAQEFEPRGKAAEEVNQLWRWLAPRLGL